MEQKRVSFKDAKAIKEAGYPQDIDKIQYGYSLNSFGYFDDPYDFDAINNYHRTSPGEIICFDSMCRFEDGCEYCVAPTYIDVWLWLWREKRCYVQTLLFKDDVFRAYIFNNEPISATVLLSKDPEEAIIAAIDYLVDNNLIK